MSYCKTCPTCGIQRRGLYQRQWQPPSVWWNVVFHYACGCRECDRHKKHKFNIGRIHTSTKNWYKASCIANKRFKYWLKDKEYLGKNPHIVVEIDTCEAGKWVKP